MAGRGVGVDLAYIDPPFATNNEFLIDADRANVVSASGRLGRRFVGMDDSPESHKVVARKLGCEKIKWHGIDSF